MPIQIVFGDNIPKVPVKEKTADGRRNQVQMSALFVDMLNSQGGRASVLQLPDAGLFGNSHFMFADRNNIEVADQLSSFLSTNGLDGWTP